MAARNQNFVLWLHGLDDSGPSNEPIITFFSSPEFGLNKWVFPSAPNTPVSATVILCPPPPRFSHMGELYYASN